MMLVIRSCILVLALSLAHPTSSTAASPAEAVINKFHDDLLSIMKRSESLGTRGRFDQLLAPIERAFHVPLVTVWVTGSHWQKAQKGDQMALIDAAKRYSAGEIAVIFDAYNGETFETLGSQDIPDGSVLVRTRLNRPQSSDLALSYRVRQFGDRWRVVDVLLGGKISQVVKRREEYARILSNEGLKGLTTLLNAKTEEILSKGN